MLHAERKGVPQHPGVPLFCSVSVRKGGFGNALRREGPRWRGRLAKGAGGVEAGHRDIRRGALAQATMSSHHTKRLPPQAARRQCGCGPRMHGSERRLTSGGRGADPAAFRRPASTRGGALACIVCTRRVAANRADAPALLGRSLNTAALALRQIA